MNAPDTASRTELSNTWAQDAIKHFDQVLCQASGWAPRAGQRQMAELVATTFANAQLGLLDDADVDLVNETATPPERHIAVIQAGTGVGKSLGYSIAAISVALARQTRVVISTATVALQEQLIQKDLPLLAAQWDKPFEFALAKGRGRYVCQLKLERWVGSDDAAAESDDELFGDVGSPHDAEPLPHKARIEWYRTLHQALGTNSWNGDKDELPTTPDGGAWGAIAAESSSCTGKHCPLFSRCGYFVQRKNLVNAQVIVVNHDLLLSSLGSRVLPELHDCLLVLDEAHHLPAVALDQFTHTMSLSNLRWIDQLAQRALHVGAALMVSDALPFPALAAQLRHAMQELGRLVAQADASAQNKPPARQPSRLADPASTRHLRLPKGEVDADMLPWLERIEALAADWIKQLASMARTLRTDIKNKPDEAHRLSALYAQMGTLAPKLEGVLDTARLMLHDDAEGHAPAAKWFSTKQSGEHLNMQAHACPTLPGSILQQNLWPRVRGVVLTSATLTSCGRFDFFLGEAGLRNEPKLRSIEVSSPFDFANQGRFEVVLTQADPRDPQLFLQELLMNLWQDLAGVTHGALVLFTSREQLRQAVVQMPSALRDSIWVQGEWPRSLLLQKHQQRVAQDLPSIIFGLQSFGEGLDLPGALCQHLFIAKLPFAPPDDPVGQSRSEWLEQQGRNPFNELVIPATSVRLAQWVGRAIRTETDQAHIVCYDKRLVQTSYGQRLLQGLPPFQRLQRPSHKL